MRPAWIEIDLAAIRHNTRELKRILRSGAEMMAVVKADAYGQGAEKVGREVLRAGADCLGVAILEEALELRENDIRTPVMVLGYTPPSQFESLIRNDVTCTVFEEEQAQELSRAAQKLGKTARVHIKVDTGMGRLGFLPGEESVCRIERIVSLPGLEVQGIYSHLAAADAADKTYACYQLNQFISFQEHLQAAKVRIPVKHIANSAALIDLPQAHLDLVRPGISLYGLLPSQEVKKDVVKLIPALSFKSVVSHVKTVPKGFSISYGCTYVAQEETTVATVPVGYADGFSRTLSNSAEVLVKGKRAPVAGRVCMDQIMLNVNRIPGVEVGNEVVIIGNQGDESISADELAHKADTINYEVVSMLSTRVPRVYIDSFR